MMHFTSVRTAAIKVGAGCTVVLITGLCLQAAGPSAAAPPPGKRAPAATMDAPARRALLDTYCVTCHNQRQKVAGLTLDALDAARVSDHADVWEKVVRKLHSGAMPPVRMPRPDAATYTSFITSLETELDRSANASPDPGRTFTFHRLNRTEYQNAIRDLLGVEGIDMSALLPADDTSYGFDNIGGVLKLSSTLLERYLSAARKISRMAVGDPSMPPDGAMYRLRDDLAQWDHLTNLPLGTRGGTLVRHYFPVSAEYVLRANVKGVGRITAADDLEFMVDGERVKLITFSPEKRGEYGGDDGETVEARVRIVAGLRSVSVAFVKTTSAVLEGIIQGYEKPQDTSPRVPFIRNLTITGPFQPATVDETPSRARVLACRPAAAADELPCARKIVSTLARFAYRRPVTTPDVDKLMRFYDVGRNEGGFEKGIARAIERILVSPAFLFRVEEDPATARPGTPYRLPDLELASRLSFFLWSSLPDDELLTVAAQGRLKNPAVMERQVRRMLASPKSEAFVRNFPGQWLQLRNLDATQPHEVVFPNFDDSLRQSLRRETELLFQSILREERSALELLNGDYTFINERLARHYGIPNVYGSHFRRVPITEEYRRGLLGQGSILTVTSYTTRTSPVVRGKWILDNLLGASPPPPPPNVPTLAETSATGKKLSMREAMEKHRANPTCATCHAQMDPLGFALENYDAVGHWRTRSEANTPIDAVGMLPSGEKFEGVNGLRGVLLSRPDRFVSTLTEKLMTYALGRGVEYYDMPAIRKIVSDAAASNYKLSSLVLGVINSVPFHMRKAQS